MTSFELSPEHEDFRASVREFAQAEIGPYAAQWDKDHHFPIDTVQKMGKLGLFGLTAPEEFGGAGEDGDFTSLCVAIEEIGRVDQSMGITLEAAVGLGINPILAYGTDEQKERWLPDLVAGEKLAGFGLTEPGSGSDAGATKTKAELVDGEWVINGGKQFITNSGSEITSVVTVTARTGVSTSSTTGLEKAEISTIIVPTGTPGFTAEKAYDKLGWHASDTHGLTLADCRVPEDHLLGQPGRGFHSFLSILDDGRVAIAALAIGCAQACLDLATEHALTRNAFGGPIARYQAVAFALSDLAVAVENARLLTYKAAWLKEQGRPITQAAAMAKLYSTEAAVTATRVATQVFGGAGFMEESPIARFYRDAKVLEIGEGTSEIQRLVIARALLGEAARDD